jgi:hypothetical protein
MSTEADYDFWVARIKDRLETRLNMREAGKERGKSTALTNHLRANKHIGRACRAAIAEVLELNPEDGARTQQMLELIDARIDEIR